MEISLLRNSLPPYDDVITLFWASRWHVLPKDHYLPANLQSTKPQKAFTWIIPAKKDIFFFHWRYNPLWVLAFSVILFHSALSSHCFLHRLTPIICRSSSMPAIHLFRGLPLVPVPIGFHCNILLRVLLSSIRITWPSQAILQLFINLTIPAFPISLFSS